MTPEAIRRHAEDLHKEMLDATYPAYRTSQATTREAELAVIERRLRIVAAEAADGGGR